MATAITADGLTTPDPLKTVIPAPDNTDYLGTLNTSLSSIQSTVDANDAAVKANLAKLSTLQTQDQSKGTDLAAAYEANGLNKEKTNLDNYTQQLNDINANISGLANEAKAIPLKVQQGAANTGATDAGVAPIQTGQLRENAIKALTQSSLADVLTANINNSTIRYNAAKDKAEQAINLKYAPIEQGIQDLKDQLALNKEYITDPAEKKLAAKQTEVLNERSRLLDIQKTNEQNVSNIVLEAAKNGAPAAVIAQVQKAKNQNEAVSFAGKYAGNYLQMELLKAQIAKQKADTAKVAADTAGVLSTADQSAVDGYVKNIQNKSFTFDKVPAKYKNAVSIALASGGTANIQAVQQLTDKSKNIQTLLEDKYLSSAVGPNPLARFSLTSGFTGGTQNFIAGVEQLTNQETLDKLTALKAAGGTLGALNESEGRMLRDSATKINNWAIKDPKTGAVSGYNTSEAAFKSELGTLKTLTDRAITNAGGTVEPTGTNAFNVALGTSGQPIPGTSIVGGFAKDGSINFNLPGLK